MEQQTPPAGQPASAPSGWGPPPGQAPVGWVQPPSPAGTGGTTALAKLGALILFLWGLLFTLLGLVAIAGGALFRDAIRSLSPDLDVGQFGDVAGGFIVIVGVVILVIAIVEMLVGVFSFRGSGFARVLGILYGLFFGLFMLAGSLGSRDLGDGTAGGGTFGLVLAASYLYTAIVFVVAYRSKA